MSKRVDCVYFIPDNACINKEKKRGFITRVLSIGRMHKCEYLQEGYCYDKTPKPQPSPSKTSSPTKPYYKKCIPAHNTTSTKQDDNTFITQNILLTDSYQEVGEKSVVHKTTDIRDNSGDNGTIHTNHGNSYNHDSCSSCHTDSYSHSSWSDSSSWSSDSSGGSSD